MLLTNNCISLVGVESGAPEHDHPPLDEGRTGMALLNISLISLEEKNHLMGMEEKEA